MGHPTLIGDMAQFRLKETIETNILMWTNSHFPAAMRSLNHSTRAKAIEIANQLVEQGQPNQQCVVAVSIKEARQWARCGRVDTDVLINQIRPFA